MQNCITVLEFTVHEHFMEIWSERKSAGLKQKEVEDCWRYVEDLEEEVMTSKEEKEAGDYVQIECEGSKEDVDETLK
jgi:hypothetical protein